MDMPVLVFSRFFLFNVDFCFAITVPAAPSAGASFFGELRKEIDFYYPALISGIFAMNFR
jgi:hypothetical protein